MSVSCAAVIGKPISHSLSPLIHNRFYEILNLDWKYNRFEVGAGELEAFLKSVPTEYAAFSVTMPLKSEAFQIAAEVDKYAEQTQAVNTLIRSAGGWRGFNTDVPGAVAAMNERGFENRKNAVVLGAGATARSLIVAGLEIGIQKFEIRARRAEGFLELKQSLPNVSLSFVQFEANAEISLTSDSVLFNTLPGTAADEVVVSNPSYLFDATYAPWPTKLSKQFDSEHVVSGKDLLVHQALLQLHLMTGAGLAEKTQLLNAVRLVIAN